MIDIIFIRDFFWMQFLKNYYSYSNVYASEKVGIWACIRRICGRIYLNNLNEFKKFKYTLIVFEYQKIIATTWTKNGVQRMSKISN